MHTTAGYLLGTSYTHEMVFDVKPDDVYWCAADIGWVTGHSYIVYGPLANATTGVMYEGAPDTPAWDRWWQIVEDYKVSILYCAPTAIRAFMKQGEQFPPATTCRRCGCWARSASRSTPRRGSGTTRNIGGGRAPDRRHVVADRDRHDPDHAAARRHRPPSPAAPPSRSRHRGGRRRCQRRDACRSAGAATWSSSGRGRRCCAASTATRSATRRRTGAASRACTSPATAPSATPTATSGCSAASTT